MFFAATNPGLGYRRAYSPASRSLERFLGEALQTSRNQAVAVEQDDQSVTLTFDVPGIAKDQLSIGLEGNVVRIQTREGATRSYKAAYELASDIDAATSEARLENGVLTLKLSKVVPVSKTTELVIS